MAKKWTAVIEPKGKLLDLKLKEVWKYRDLIFLFVRRNLATKYKQTILGPLWFIIQPLFTTIIQTVVFGNIAGLTQGVEQAGVPSFLFFMAGNLPWTFFSACLTGTSSTFTGNAGIFGKVYFPRLVSPISTILTNLVNFGIQFAMFIGFWVYFIATGSSAYPTWYMFMLPIILVQVSLLGLGFGIIISSMTTKYRDLTVFVGFGVSLLMYLSPIIYPLSTFSPESTMYNLLMCNPITPLIEIFKNGTIGIGEVNWMYYGISWAVTIIMLFVGLIIFNKVEKTFMDTV